MSSYLENFHNSNVKRLEKVLSFTELLGELSKFRIANVIFDDKNYDLSNSLKVDDYLNSEREKLSIRPFNTDLSRVCVYNTDCPNAKYYCNANVRDIVELCILLISGEKVLRCPNVPEDEDSICFNLLKEIVPIIFKNESYVNTPAFFLHTVVLPYNITFTESELLDLCKVNWQSISTVFVPDSIKFEDLTSRVYEINGSDIILIGEEISSFETQDVQLELENIPENDILKFQDIVENFQTKLSSLKQNFAYENSNDSYYREHFTTVLKVIASRYSLICEIYSKLCKEGKHKKYLYAQWHTTNVYELELLASICAVYCYFNNKKIIMDTNHAAYAIFSKTLHEISRGSMLSPYLVYKRLLGIRKDLKPLNTSMFRPILRKTNGSTPVLSFPLRQNNEQPCYLFPLRMFIAYLNDEMLSSTIEGNAMTILSLPRNKEIPINLKKCTLDNIAVNESVQLILPEDICKVSKFLDGNTKEELIGEGQCTWEALEGFTKDCEKDVMLSYLESKDIGFENDSCKLKLHDWILNPSERAWLTINDYLKSVFSAQERNTQEVNYESLLTKILGFSSISDINNIYNVNEWSSGVTATGPISENTIISKSGFESSNYEKSEFYSFVCETIMSILAYKSDNSKDSKYVTLHDIMLGTMEVNGNTEVYIVYAPLNPEMLWLNVEPTSLSESELFSDDLAVSVDKLSGIPDTLFNFSEDNSEEDFICNNLNRMLRLSESDTTSIRDWYDNIMLKDLFTRWENSQYVKAFELVDGELKDPVRILEFIEDIRKTNNVINLNNYLDSNEVDYCVKLCLWFVATKFIGYYCNIPEKITLDGKLVERPEYGLNVFDYLYSDYYNVIGYENLSELAEIINPDKHLKYCRVINPFGGILRDQRKGSKYSESKVFCTTSMPGDSGIYQYTNSRFMSNE